MEKSSLSISFSCHTQCKSHNGIANEVLQLQMMHADIDWL